MFAGQPGRAFSHIKCYKQGMSENVRDDWPVTIRAGTAEEARRIGPRELEVETTYEEPEILRSKLDYIRRYGAVMGMCMYELRASK